MCPGRHCAGGGIWRGEILNTQICPLLTNWRLYCSQTVLFYTSNTPQFRDHTHNCQCSTIPHEAVCTPRNLNWWSDWTFTCCKTVEDPYCPVTVLLAIAIQCFALFTCLKILHKIWKFCMIYGNLILKKISKFVATRCQLLRLICTTFNFGWGPDPVPAGGELTALPQTFYSWVQGAYF